LLTEQPDKITVEFHISSCTSIDHRKCIAAYCIVSIHPSHNADFCRYYHETPGDLPNFYVGVRGSEGQSEMIDELETLDDLSDWLKEFQSTTVPA
jgi:hypothetical protein